ncbi:hypothetical protein C8J57DRAFT_1535466 [Mycena rebaudengoi]|nr:hypothetical protein C8J57DRAFT_1535466 [Mycena rebaudengoi]
MPPAIAVPPALLSLILHAFLIPLFGITATRLYALVYQPLLTSTITDSQAIHCPPVPLPTVHLQGPLHPLLPSLRRYRLHLLETPRQPAVFVDQNPSLPALPPGIVQIRSAPSCSPHRYALNYPHSFLLLRSLLYAQNSALCALFTLARYSAPFLCSWLGHTPNPPGDTLRRVPCMYSNSKYCPSCLYICRSILHYKTDGCVLA